MSLDIKKVASASKALKKYLKSQESDQEKAQLFEEDGQFVYLVVKSKRFFSENRNLKPKLVELPTSIWSTHAEAPSVCAFVRDPQREYKDALLGDGEAALKRCIGVFKLKGKFKPFEARRALRSDYDVFLGEEEVVPMLPKLLGKAFYGKQQYIPISIKLRAKSQNFDADKVQAQIDRILKSTTLLYTTSQTMAVRIGTTKHTDKQLAANAAKVMETVGFENILEVDVKTTESPSLPVYYAEKVYSESDIGEENDPNFETEGQKRKRDDAHLDELLAEVVDEDEIKEYNREQKKLRKQKLNQNKEEKE